MVMMMLPPPPSPPPLFTPRPLSRPRPHLFTYVPFVVAVAAAAAHISLYLRLLSSTIPRRAPLRQKRHPNEMSFIKKNGELFALHARWMFGCAGEYVCSAAPRRSVCLCEVIISCSLRSVRFFSPA